MVLMRVAITVAALILANCYTSGVAHAGNDGQTAEANQQRQRNGGCRDSAAAPIRLAIVGAGIGGSATAYYVRQELDKVLKGSGAAVDIHVYDQSDRVCGRLRSMVIGGQSFEVGAAVAHPKNQYISDLTYAVGLEKLPAATGDFGLVLGPGQYVPLGDATHSWSEDFFLLERYGLDVVNLDLLLGYLFNEFTDIYRLQSQDPPMSFTTLHDLLGAMRTNFTQLASQGFADYLNASGIPERLVNELVSATANAVYNQDGRVMTALSGMTALARSANDKYWSVLGGNERLCERLLNTTQGVTLHLGTRVTRISGANASSLSVTAVTDHGAEGTGVFDHVVLAMPLNASAMELSGFAQALPPLNPGRGQTTTVTLVKGDANLTYFGLDAEGVTAPWLFAMPAGNGLPVSVIENTPPVDGMATAGKPVWKVQSTEPLGAEFLDLAFPAREATVQHTFDFAYPHFTAPDPLGPLQLAPRLVYGGGIEWASSAMEMSAISARNSALLVAKAVLDEIENCRGDVP
ncbi:prenylcysteine oxidase 1-like [Sycon ciliatum]|uniref:prenylcysteine oxidase 1-like n=1 Tax=Sycon ciliatum TaxID=27933 RepID=UPI0020AEDFBB